MTTAPTVTLCLAAAAALLHLWLSLRVGAVRRRHAVSIGDGGHDAVIRRMRAHANFGENVAIIVPLVLALELARGPSLWLWAAAAIFVAARLLHAFGMDGWHPGRSIGITATFGLELALAVWALAIPLTAHSANVPASATEIVPAQG